MLDIKTKISIENITTDSVTVVRIRYINVDNKQIPIETLKNTYINTSDERMLLKNLLQDDNNIAFYNAIMEIWGVNEVSNDN